MAMETLFPLTLPSPSGRGNGFPPFLQGHRLVNHYRRGRPSSLSLRERAGVRGNSARNWVVTAKGQGTECQ
jgi:hypothetical protein